MPSLQDEEQEQQPEGRAIRSMQGQEQPALKHLQQMPEFGSRAAQLSHLQHTGETKCPQPPVQASNSVPMHMTL